jgi:hypothetical protein
VAAGEAEPVGVESGSDRLVKIVLPHFYLQLDSPINPLRDPLGGKPLGGGAVLAAFLYPSREKILSQDVGRRGRLLSS